MTALTAPQAMLAGGRTNQVWRDRDIVWKRYLPQNATPLFANDPDAEWIVLNALKGQGIAPDPVSRETRSGATYLAYRHLIGKTHATPMSDLARLMGRLHALSAPPSLPQSTMGNRVVAEGMVMAGGDPVLLAITPDAPDQPLHRAFCHRDPVPGNVVQTPDGPRLIDWQCPGQGDPIEDIAHALSPAMHALYGSTAPTTQDREAFLDAYPDEVAADRYRTQGRAFHWRMACYCHWQVARGNVAYGPALTAELDFLNG